MNIDIPEGKDAIEYVWGEMVPGIGIAASKFSLAVYANSTLELREFEAARLRIAQINGCLFCLDWRTDRGDGVVVEDGFDAAVASTGATPTRSTTAGAAGGRVRRAVRARSPRVGRRVLVADDRARSVSRRSWSCRCRSARGWRSGDSTTCSDSTPCARCLDIEVLPPAATHIRSLRTRNFAKWRSSDRVCTRRWSLRVCEHSSPRSSTGSRQPPSAVSRRRGTRPDRVAPRANRSSSRWPT